MLFLVELLFSEAFLKLRKCETKQKTSNGICLGLFSIKSIISLNTAFQLMSDDFHTSGHLFAV